MKKLVLAKPWYNKILFSTAKVLLNEFVPCTVGSN